MIHAVKHRALAAKVAHRCIMGSAEWSELAPILLHSASQVQIAISQIEAMVNRATRLIDSSPQKEHIYSEAGDMITGIRGLLTEAAEGAATLSYAAGKVNEKKLKGDVAVAIKDGIDDAIKKKDGITN